MGPRIGLGPNDAKEASAFNRVLTGHDDRIEYEVGPRQAEPLIDECGLIGANQMTTLGAKYISQDHAADREFDPKLHTPFRRAAARGNYLSADRIDAQYACKEICRYMSTPTDSPVITTYQYFHKCLHNCLRLTDSPVVCSHSFTYVHMRPTKMHTTRTYKIT